MTRRAIVTGAAGQDGRLLSALLARRGDVVFGVTRAGLVTPDGATLPIDLANAHDVKRMFDVVSPDLCFHLAGASSQTSFAHDDSEFVVRSTSALLEACGDRCRLFFAGSCAMFGSPAAAPQHERTPFHPTSDYGRAKVAAHRIVVDARARGVFAVTGILYNHESPLRDERFVTRRISRGVALIARGELHELVVGNLDAVRDWGCARETVDAVARMLDMDTPEDLVIATGRAHTVRDLVEAAFAAAHIPVRVRSDAAFVRAESGAPLVGDPTRAFAAIGWRAVRPIEDVMREMVESEP